MKNKYKDETQFPVLGDINYQGGQSLLKNITNYKWRDIIDFYQNVEDPIQSHRIESRLEQCSRLPIDVFMLMKTSKHG